VSIRLQLLIVALTTLVLPWAGCQYARELETALRDSQEKSLLASAGTIAKASYLGSHREYSIDTVAGPLFATCPRVERPLGVGTAVALSLAARGVIVVGD